MATASTDNPLERVIEAKVVEYAKSLEFRQRKMNGAGFRGWPDRIFHKDGRTFYIEFKRKGGRLSPGQGMVIRDLRAAKIAVYVIDNVEDGKKVIDEYQRKSS